MEAAVPVMGSWKTRPRRAARLCSGRWVISRPPRVMVPLSIWKVPAMALSMVLLPAPLPPMTVMKSPLFRVRSTPASAILRMTVPGLKVFRRSLRTSISSAMVFPSLQLPGEDAVFPVGHGQEDGHDQRGEQLQVVGVQAQPQHHLDDQVIDDGAQGHGQEL